jgi:Holliday junction resolvase
MREKNIENNIKKYLKSKGAYYVKYFGNSFSQVGVPDILACYKGRFIGIEVKNEKGKTSPLQDFNLMEIKKAGGISLVARDPKDVETVLDNIDRGVHLF